MTSIEQLYHEHHQPLRYYLVRLLDDPVTAEDVSLVVDKSITALG